MLTISSVALAKILILALTLESGNARQVPNRQAMSVYDTEREHAALNGGRSQTAGSFNDTQQLSVWKAWQRRNLA